LSTPFQLTDQQLATFDADGVLRLPGFIPGGIIKDMARRLWADLTARYGALPADPKSWPSGLAFKFQHVVKSGAFNGLDTPDMRALLDQLVGLWEPPKVWGQPLVTFPHSDAWDLRRLAWHTDYPATAVERPLPAVRFFVYLASVRSRGGATLVARGSHRAMMNLSREMGGSVRSADARGILETRSTWLRALFSKAGDEGDRIERFMERDGDLCGAPVRVEELTGEPGDVVVMHPGMLHAGSPNALDTPRMMLVQSVVQKNWMATFRY
jgi:hypothetical protein